MLAKVFLVLMVSTTVLCQLPGTNYQTADGHVRSESVDEEGNVRGQYSYIDPNGKTITVKYTAGKNGFQVENENALQQEVPQAPQEAVHPSFNTAPHQFPAQPAPSQSPFPFSTPASQQGLFSPSTNPFVQAASRAQVEQFGQAQAEAAQFPATPSPTQFTAPAGVPTPAPSASAPAPSAVSQLQPGRPTQSLLAGFNLQFPPEFLQLQRAAQAKPLPQPLASPQLTRTQESLSNGLQYSGTPQQSPVGPQFVTPNQLGEVPADFRLLSAGGSDPRSAGAPTNTPDFSQLHLQPQLPIAPPAQFLSQLPQPAAGNQPQLSSQQQQLAFGAGQSQFIPQQQLGTGQPQYVPQQLAGSYQQQLLSQQLASQQLPSQEGTAAFPTAENHRFALQSPSVQDFAAGAYRFQSS